MAIPFGENLNNFREISSDYQRIKPKVQVMTLILLPNLLDTTQKGTDAFSQEVIDKVSILDGLIAESEKQGRRFLKRFQLKKKPHEIPLALLNEHTRPDEFDFYLEPIQQGETWGLISDCGLPSLADPGSKFVCCARMLNIPIEAYAGPSSITLSLLLSGLPAQRFCFHGYVAKEPHKREEELLKWERRSRQENETQLFIETPYRNLAAFQSCLSTLAPKTFLCVAKELGSPLQSVHTFPIFQWRKSPLPDLQKKPTIFLFWCDYMISEAKRS